MYQIYLWDHELNDEQGGWSIDLARDFLAGVNVFPSAREAVKAIRRLRSFGWDRPTMYVERLEEVIFARRPL